MSSPDSTVERSSPELDRPDFSEGVKLNLVVCGSDDTLKSSISEQILQQTDRRSDVDLHGRQISLVDLPALFNTRLSEEEVMRQALRCVSLCHPGVHVFLLIIPDAPLNNEDRAEMEEIQRIFSSRINKHVMILIMQNSEHQTEELNEETQSVIERFGGRHHFFGPNTQVSTLMENIEKMLEENRGEFYSTETFLEVQMEKLMKYEEMKKKIDSPETHLLSQGPRENTDEVRIVLLGKTGVGKSSTGNTILGRDAFKAEESHESVTKESQRESSEINGRRITVIDTPGLFDTELSNEEIQREIRHCISMILPGPHVFLLLIPLGRFTKEEQKSVKIIQETFGEKSLMFTMVLFTRGDDLKNKTIEQYLGKPGTPLMKLIEACGNRFHVFNNNQTGDRTQVSDLLEKIDNMVRVNGGSFYSCKMFREMEREKQEQQMKILMDRVREREELMKKLEEEKESMKMMMEEERQNQDKERKRREEKMKREIREEEKHQREIRDEMRRERETFKHEILEMRQEKENLQLRYDTEIDKLINRIKNEQQNNDKERNKWEEDEKIREREKQISDEQIQRLRSEKEGIIRERERIEGERREQLEDLEKRLTEERNKREDEQKTSEEKQKLNETLQHRNLKMKIDVMRAHHENILYEKIKELAIKLKDKRNDEETLKKEFDLFWEQSVKKIIRDTPAIRDIDVMRDVREILSDLYSVSVDHWRESRNIFSVPSYSDYIQLKRSSGFTRAFRNYNRLIKDMHGLIISKEDEAQIRSLVTDVSQQTDRMIQSFNISKKGYNISCIQQLTNYIKVRVTKYEEEQVKYVFKNEFFMDLFISICKRSNKMITDQHRLFREANDLVIYVEKKREQYYSIFQKYCHGSTSAVMFGAIICQKLKESIEQSVYKKTARDLRDEMRSNCESLKENRSNLEKHILKTLAEEEDFDKYMDYIHNPRDHFKSFIRDEVSRYISDNFSVSVLPKMKENIELLQWKIMKAAHVSTEHVQEKRGNVGLWLKRFTEKISDVLIFSKKDLSGVKHDDVDDFNLLKDVMRHELPAIIYEISSYFNDFLWKLDYKFRPDELLIDHFCQCCWVQCPFCKAICTNNIENHHGDHSVRFHRVNGLSVFYYEGTQNLCMEFCSTVVRSSKSFKSSDQWFPFKEYRRAGGVYGKWSITPDLSELLYWKWFVCRFQKDLEKYYNKTFEEDGEIPDEWRRYSKQDAIESLDQYV